MINMRKLAFALGCAVAPLALTAGQALAEPARGAASLAASAQAVAAGEDDRTIRVRVSRPGEGSAYQSLNIALNKTAIIEFEEDIDDIIVANPQIADVLARSKRRIAVMARGKGESSIIFMNNAGEEVLSLDVIVAGQGVQELQSLIGRYVPTSTIKAEFVNGTVILSGGADTLSDADTAIQIASQFIGEGKQVLNMVNVKGKDQVLLKVRVVEMQRSVIKQLGVNLTGTMNVGEFASESVRQLFDATTGRVLYDEQGEVLTGLVPSAPWSNSASLATNNSLGISGQPLGGLTGGASYQNYRGSSLQSSAGFTLDMLERVGLVRTLAEPNLTALSGENAKFLAGGEFPVPGGVDDAGNVLVNFKPFGVGLGFTPVVLSAGRISMRISTEVSELSTQGGLQIGGTTVVTSDGNTISSNSYVIPALKLRRADTTVELPSGGSLVIAGLIQEQTKQAMDAVPGMGNLPVLGSLFRSREFQNDESELVVVVTPYLVEPTDPNKLRDPDDGYVTARDAAGILFGRLNEVYGVEGAKVSETQGAVGAGFIID